MVLEPALSNICRIENWNIHVGQWLGSEQPGYPLARKHFFHLQNDKMGLHPIAGAKGSSGSARWSDPDASGGFLSHPKRQLPE
jgi:hypothetical protein